jgi:hypothetical protein
MSLNPMAWEGGVNPRVETCPPAQACLLPMGLTSENVADRYKIPREVQDQFAARSHAKAAAAQVRLVSETRPAPTPAYTMPALRRWFRTHNPIPF